ncbi:MAG: hypothetical protein WBI21_02170 [Natronincolaceae bacterium]|jgi:hypothetical protein|nr:hypothetical protein [Bacillota bacterium]NLK90598.1 hypothetical protein [Clostridiales bacterium]
MERREQNSQTQPNWLPFFLFLLFVYCKDANKLNFQEVNMVNLGKKSQLLNRIKGYMNPQEQYVIHSAEIILQIIAKIKTLMDLSQTGTAEIAHSVLSLEDKKRNMLTDLSRFLEDEISELVSEGEAEEKIVELKKLASILEMINNLKGEGKINELDIMEIIQPLINKEQGDSLMRMVQTFKVMNGMKGADTPPVG